MRKFLTLWRRELTACFLSPIAYVTVVAFVLVCGVTFLAGAVNNEGTNAELPSLLFGSVVLWLTFLASVASMRLFTEEKRSGTIETLMTAPVTDTQIVMGKFFGALVFVTLAVAPVVASLYLLERVSPGLRPEDIDAGAVAAGSLLVFLVSATFVAIGLLVSLTTRNQIVAAIGSLAAIWVVFLLGDLVAALPFQAARFGEYLSVPSNMEQFSRGCVDTRPIVLYASATALLLFAAVRTLESKRWR
jgi:ABC-2 type transport system permease protein